MAGESSEIGTFLEPVGKVTIGQIDPRTLSRQQFDSSNERLFHGASANFAFDSNFDYQDPSFLKFSIGSFTLGSGFYTVPDKETAAGYSQVRQFGNKVDLNILTLLPYQATMLDLRVKTDNGKNAPVPKELFEKWQKHYLENYVTPDIPFASEFREEYAEHLQKVSRLPDIDLRVMLWTAADKRIGDDCYPAPSWSELFSRFIREEGYDGIIYNEGVEKKNSRESPTYVFYNLGKIGTYESWQKQK